MHVAISAALALVGSAVWAAQSVAPTSASGYSPTPRRAPQLGPNLVVGPWIPSPTGRVWYVSPTGASTGDGSMAKPWDIQTALSASTTIQPGDMVFLRGGVYGAGGNTIFTSKLNGTASTPIIVRAYNSELVTINGGLQVDGTYTWFWGFEITNRNPQRYVTTTYVRSPGLNLNGHGNKAINLVIHDTGHPGIGFWRQGDGGEIYGCIVWGIGEYDITPPYTVSNPWVRGSGVYAQNDTGAVKINDSIWFWNFNVGLKGYGAAGGVNGFNVDGNVAFDNGQWDMFFGTNPPDATLNPVTGLSITNNFIYNTGVGPISLVLGDPGGKANNDVVVRNNILANAYASDIGIQISAFSSVQIVDNTIIAKWVEAEWEPPTGSYSLSWDHNTYYGAKARTPFYTAHTGYQFPEWQALTGQDLTSTFTPSYPTDMWVRVRPNRYDPTRANIIVYNWPHQAYVDVSLTGIVRTGARYEIRDVQNYLGRPVVTGTYYGGKVRIPLNLSTASTLIGAPLQWTPTHTPNEFNTFVVKSIGGV